MQKISFEKAILHLNTLTEVTCQKLLIRWKYLCQYFLTPESSSINTFFETKNSLQFTTEENQNFAVILNIIR